MNNVFKKKTGFRICAICLCCIILSVFFSNIAYADSDLSNNNGVGDYSRAVHWVRANVSDLSVSSEDRTVVGVKITNLVVQIPPFCNSPIDYRFEYKFYAPQIDGEFANRHIEGTFNGSVASHPYTFSFPVKYGTFEYRIIASFHGEVQESAWEKIDVGSASHHPGNGRVA